MGTCVRSAEPIGVSVLALGSDVRIWRNAPIARAAVAAPINEGFHKASELGSRSALTFSTMRSVNSGDESAAGDSCESRASSRISSELNARQRSQPARCAEYRSFGE